MKLARPNVFDPGIVFAGCPALVHGDGDDADLASVLRGCGLHAGWLSWDDPATLDADLVILRATWDYTDRLEEFLAWTRRVRHLLNSPEIVEWNTDKRYLTDLARAGIPTVPSRFFEPGEPVSLPVGEVVVKPAVGAGSRGAHRFTDPTAARQHATALQTEGRTVLVQPYDERVEGGETALVFIAGRQSHAFTKGPMLPPAGQPAVLHDSGTYVEESLSLADPDCELWDFGYSALAAVTNRFNLDSKELLYARVDIIGGLGEPRLLELELVEPGLGWLQLDASTRASRQRQFALGVESALARFGRWTSSC